MKTRKTKNDNNRVTCCTALHQKPLTEYINRQTDDICKTNRHLVIENLYAFL